MEVTKFGIHVSNKNHREFDRLVGLGVTWYTALHVNSGEIDRIVKARPDAQVVVRFYLPRWSDIDPTIWAEECARWARTKPHLRHFTPANEMNLPYEGGGWSREDYEAINAWLLKWSHAFRTTFPDAILHWPALAQGHYEDGRHEDGYNLGWAGYELCQPSIAAYDVIDVHPYWQYGGVGLWDTASRWYAWRFVHDRERFFNDKPVFISECGNFNAQGASTLGEMVYFFLKLYEYDWVLGATPFIWDSGPEHARNIWIGNDALIDGITDIVKPHVGVELPRPRRPTRYVDMIAQLPTVGEYADRNLGDITHIVIHHTVGWSPDEVQYLSRISEAHIRRGWPRIGYHYCIGRDGTIYRTNQLWKLSYHAGEGNSYSVGVAFLGNYDSQEWLGISPMEPTAAQIQAANVLTRRIRHILQRPIWVIGHRDIRATICPGENLYRIIGDEIR